MNKTICIRDLCGYATRLQCCMFLEEVARELQTRGNKATRVSVDTVRIEDNRFHLDENGDMVDLRTNTWFLAATAVELFTGIAIFNGRRENQREDTPIPSLLDADALELNRLLQHCLQYCADKRPEIAEVIERSSHLRKQEMQRKRPTRKAQGALTQAVTNRIDTLWPENILDSIRNMVCVLLLAMMSVSSLMAQTPPSLDATMKVLLNSALHLRTNSEKEWNTVEKDLKSIKDAFTLMDELKDRTHDCALVGNKVSYTGVNRMATRIKNSEEVAFSGQEMLDGSDSRYNYSIFEKGIKAKQTAEYSDLHGRSGKQVFLVVPYKSNQQYTAIVYGKNWVRVMPTYVDKNTGVSYFVIDAKNCPGTGETFTITVENKETENVSFVFINYNSRR